MSFKKSAEKSPHSSAKPVQKKAPRIERLFRLLGLLQQGCANIETLIQELGVSERSVFRYIKELRGYGFVIDRHSVTKNYVLHSRVALPESHFEFDEALAMIILCMGADRTTQLPFLDASRRAMMKLLQMLPEKLLEDLTDLNQFMEIQWEPIDPLLQAKNVFQAVRDAIQTRKILRMDYSPPIEPSFTTNLRPYRLFFNRRTWYVIGWSSRHREVRTFHLGRIDHFRITEESYTIPPGFTLRQYLGNAWHMIREPGPDQQVVVRFSPLVAQNVKMVQWHPTQKTFTHEDGSMNYFVTVSGLKEISWWILGYGKEAEAIEPPALRDIIRKHVGEMAKKYE